MCTIVDSTIASWLHQLNTTVPTSFALLIVDRQTKQIDQTDKQIDKWEYSEKQNGNRQIDIENKETDRHTDEKTDGQNTKMAGMN